MRQKRDKVLEEGKNTSRATEILRTVVLVSFGLMLAGFIVVVVQNSSMPFPGPSTISLSKTLTLSKISPGILAMSAGLLLFAITPGLRVLLGFEHFIQNKDIINAVIAMIVLMELLISIFI